MNKLRWDKPDAPCLLCGVPVTPEAWAGGVVAWDGGPSWWGDFHGRPDMSTWWGKHTPIFPPRGWAGKTDAELWDEMYGDGPMVLLDLWNFGGIRVIVTRNGKIGISASEHNPDYGTCPPYFTDDPGALIQALQNAQVLARRLRDE